MTPEALRRRMAHGNVYPAERIDAALGNYFRAGNLGALRELALLWVADRVDEALDEYRARPRDRAAVGDARARRSSRSPAPPTATGSSAAPPDGAAREGRPRRGARPLAGRPDGRGGRAARARSGRSSSALGGTYRDVVGDDVGKALVDTARAHERHADRARRHPPLAADRAASAGSVIRRVIRDSGEDIDVHVISHARATRRTTPSGRRRPTSTSRGTAWSPGARLAAVVLPLAHGGARAAPRRPRAAERAPPLPPRSWSSSRRSAASGRRSPPRSPASSSPNWYFTPPLYTFTIGEGENLLALAIFLVVAATVSGLRLPRRASRERGAARARRGRDPRAARRNVDASSRSSSRSAGPSRSTASPLLAPRRSRLGGATRRSGAHAERGRGSRCDVGRRATCSRSSAPAGRRTTSAGCSTRS